MDQGPALTTNDLSARLVVLEKNRLLDALLLAAIPVGILAFATFAAWHFAPGALGIHAAVIAAVVRFSVARQNANAKPVERHVHASATGVVVDDITIPRSRIAEGWFQPRPAFSKELKKRPVGSTVQLFDRQKRIIFEAEVENELQATAFLRALGLDASQKRATFSVVSPFVERQSLGAVLMLVACAIAFGLRNGHVINGPLSIAILGLVALVMAVPAKLDVGVDGILHRWLGRRKFIPMSQIVSAMGKNSTAIRLELSGGKEQIIQTTSRKHRGGVFSQRRDVILARIREAHASHRDLGAGAELAALVGRAGRTLSEWKTALAALENADPSYRRAAIREDDLWRVVEDPRASEDARGGAAILLRKKLDHDGKARVRIAAEATASPKLRVALSAASDGSEDAALEALEALEAKAPALRVGEF